MQTDMASASPSHTAAITFQEAGEHRGEETSKEMKSQKEQSSRTDAWDEMEKNSLKKKKKEDKKSGATFKTWRK